MVVVPDRSALEALMSKVIKAIRGLVALPLDGDSELAMDGEMPR